MLSLGVTRITSRQHVLVRRCRAVAAGDEPATILLDGLHLVQEALSASIPLRPLVVSSAVVDRPEVQALLLRASSRGHEVVEAAATAFDAMSPVRSPSGVLALADRPQAAGEQLWSGTASPIVLACDIQDPGNVGALLRVAEAAGAAGVLVAGACADPLGWKALRGSMGSALRLPMVTYADAASAAREARRHGFALVATVPQGGTSMFDADLTGPIALAIGAEGRGLPADLVDQADLRVTVPMTAPVESLNAAVTAAVLLYEARRQRQARLDAPRPRVTTTAGA